MRTIITVLILGGLAACAPSGPGAGPAPATDSTPDTAGSDAAWTDGDAAELEGGARPGDDLPEGLPGVFSRSDDSPPVPDAEVTAFTQEVLDFLAEIRYFDYVLYTTHGVDASTGLRDWQFWYNERFRKEGELVTFFHPENPDDGGHNLHIPLSRVLGDALAAALLTEDPAASLAATQLCKGMSASMLGMVHDGQDPLPHLMARNVVAFNHEFTTHDGKRKAVDYSGWFSEYERWNCARFPYEENPEWGLTWVTSMRSKDDVCHLFRLVPSLRYASSRAMDAGLREACGETLTLLEAFAKDIVDSGYRIRTKDRDGVPFMPGFTGDPEVDQQQGDLSSFVHWNALIPGAECNNRRAAELIASHAGGAEDCGTGEPNLYDQAAFEINRYNKRICQYFHLAHLANALVNRDDAAAMRLLEGLEVRMTQDLGLPEAEMQYAPDDHRRNMALFLAQSQAFGYPLTGDEVRLIHTYYRRAVERTRDWPYWDPWDASVPDLEEASYRPPDCATEGEETLCWWRVEDLAQLFETCWSPFTNPSGARYVDCDLVRKAGR
ncbi:MAG: hypothetical protein FJ098_01445 [Deltaproteobacteria bacterium]|nr:hypothetical protein [Deltaproteobacteria bacterium]